MRDGRTREVRADSDTSFADFLARNEVAVVILSGGAKGTEHCIDQPRVTIGRGPGVDLAFDDDTMSREHAAIEFASDELRLRDLGSTNGTVLNDSRVTVGSLKHGDRFKVGSHEFQLVLQDRERTPQTYVLPDA